MCRWGRDRCGSCAGSRRRARSQRGQVRRSEWPADPKLIKKVRASWQPGVGDRQQEIVFIGLGIDQEALVRDLNACLLTKEELRQGDLVGIYQVQSTGISNYQFESFLQYQTVILPPVELQRMFDDQVKPIGEMRDSIAIATIALKKTRDLILPLLISGQLSVEHLDIQFPPGMAEE